MNSVIKYKMRYMPHRWPDGLIDTWCLCKVVEPELNVSAFDESFEVVAVFPRDSDGGLFQNHLHLGGTVEIDPGHLELIEVLSR